MKPRDYACVGGDGRRDSPNVVDQRRPAGVALAVVKSFGKRLCAISVQGC